MYESDIVRVGEVPVPLNPMGSIEEQSIRLFTDRSVVEVFLDEGRHCVTRVVDTLLACNRVLVLRSDATLASIDYWHMGHGTNTFDAVSTEGYR